MKEVEDGDISFCYTWNSSNSRCSFLGIFQASRQKKAYSLNQSLLNQALHLTLALLGQVSLIVRNAGETRRKNRKNRIAATTTLDL
jgi:hypothetical protein